MIIRSANHQPFLALLFTISIITAPGRADSILPPIIDQALREAEAHDDFCASYTMAFQWKNEERITARFDGARNSWTILEGDIANLSKAARKKFHKYQRLESRRGGLVYADYRDHMSGFRETEETATAITYNFTAPQAPKSVGDESVTAKLILDKKAGHINLYSIRANKPFKPNPASKLDEFIFEQTFERYAPDQPAVMTKVHVRAKGTRLLGKIDEDFDVKFYDFVEVNPR